MGQHTHVGEHSVLSRPRTGPGEMNPPAAHGIFQRRILIADDHPLFREGVRQMLHRQEDLFCCGEASTVEATRAAVTETKPDLVLLDLRLGTGDGLELIKALKAEHPQLKILVISQCEEAHYAERALRAGANGYLMKEEATEEVLTAVNAILGGGYHVSRKMSVLVLHKLLQTPSQPGNVGVDVLTDRELQVFQMLGAGMHTRQIAAELGLSFKTIETYRENIKHKLGFKTALILVQAATEWVRGRK